MKLRYRYKFLGVVLAAIGVAIAALGFFQVREILAELLIFTILFVAVGLALYPIFHSEGCSEQISHLIVRHLRKVVVELPHSKKGLGHFQAHRFVYL